MSKPKERIHAAADLALHLKTTAYRLMTLEEEDRLEFARFFLDEFCSLSNHVRASEDDARLLLARVSAGFAPTDYFYDPAFGEAVSPDIPYAVFQSVMTGYYHDIFKPAFDSCDLRAVYLKAKRHLYFFTLVHSTTTPEPISEAQVDEFVTLTVDIMVALKSSISKTELANLLGIRGMV